ARQHTLILDVDCKSQVPLSSVDESYLDLIHSTLTLLFIPAIPHFTYIVAKRANGGGLHIHLPEMTIPHDDYILLCQQLQSKLNRSVRGKYEYNLDILTNGMLTGAAKPGNDPYQPIRIIYVDEKSTHTLNLKCNTLSEQFKKTKQSFKRNKTNTESFFRKLLFLNADQCQRL
ncbi:SF3 helicase domain-containing protein, partial [Caerostris darwini]